MDDTIENLCEAWVNYLNQKHGTTVKCEDICNWDMWRAFPTLSRAEVYAPLYERGMWESVRPIKDADYYLRRLIEDGHQIVIVTASAPETVNLKLSNVLFRYFPYFTYEDVIITSQKSLVNGDILIDDGPHNFINWSHDGILMSAPHNRGFDAEGFGLTRADNWREVYDAVCKIASKE